VFDDKSRYKSLPVKTHVTPDGRERRYVARRFVPDPAALRTMATVKVTDSERLDLIAHRTLGEPTAFWRIADANAAMDPDEVLAPAGRRLRVPAPI
jgi:hypothetical protein